MYDLWFYGIYWVAGFLFAFPVLLVGYTYTYLKPPPPPPNIPPLRDLVIRLEKVDKEKNQEAYHELFQDFNTHYTNLPKHIKEGDWLNAIKNFAESDLLDIDSTVKFGQDLEDANPKLKKAISNTVGLALKHKKKD
ncbi:hypothetical protein [Helicobacter heilmannii]|uniref:Putative n=1 Tax=Helicobacter heilmannii TaxID=35817 RepID=A0A0K2XJH3_HELHE|nr:hypothetical protein [Helicobacter heilmannii]CCM11169.1 hypothetical protein BN341_19040 [Helicobacter heilmannii ASB1.4]CRF45173.1 hypothetical protein HHE014_01260 [Helicobacter heilmannii]CRF47446.1 hypothetical protein HHE02_07350 [Helicobacter heilmannii]CRF49172.1 hypothetical protein HHE03_07700 [Helicobacter heilmannii]CRF51686.1 hypothetical protein HHE06_15800 [Helicobacter heilmannii]